MQLLDYREKLLAMKAVKCQLKHEQVKTDASGMPMTMPHPDMIAYQRIGFCPQAIRAERIGCAHTMVRYSLNEALKYLCKKDHLNHSIYLDMQNSLSELEEKIYRLDHEKGHADKAFANARAQRSPTHKNEDTELWNKIKKIRIQHDSCVEAMEKIRIRAIEYLDLLWQNSCV